MYSRINAATNNIPTTFGTGAGSLIVDGAPSGGQLQIINTTQSDIVFTMTSLPTTTPSDSIATNPGQYVVPAAPSGGGSINTHDFLTVTKGDRIFIKAPDGTVSTGKVLINIW